METNKEKKNLVYIEFWDPTYNSGWVDKNSLPTLEEAIQVGCGIEISATDDSVTIAMFMSKCNTLWAVFSPFVIPRKSIIEYSVLGEIFVAEKQKELVVTEVKFNE